MRHLSVHRGREAAGGVGGVKALGAVVPKYETSWWYCTELRTSPLGLRMVPFAARMTVR